MIATDNLTLTSSTRVLVTGATGALGRALIDYLLRETLCQIVAIGRTSLVETPPSLL
ncbi:MAG: hypothetical protein HC782_04270, partial [Gammaproteobacteria bacterium]|nr:hypothetical protein [Gammaproteobacteria bacterium]